MTVRKDKNSPQDFGYYFALNMVFLFLMTLINSRSVRRFAPAVYLCHPSTQ